MTSLDTEDKRPQEPQPSAAAQLGRAGLGRGKYAIIAGVCLLAAGISFWDLSTRSMKSHECFVSVTAREMVVSGNYIMPTMNGRMRLQKPPLSYWLVAGISRLRGQVDEFSARLPSAVGGFLSAIAIIYFVSRWTSLRTGLLSASLWVTTLGFMEWSHNARSEMLMTFLCTLCLLSFFDIQRYGAKRRRVLVVVFWMSLALANLAKMPIPFCVVLLPIIGYTLLRKKLRMVKRLHVFIGLLVTLAIVLPWFIMIANRLNWDLTLWRNEVLSRFGGDYATRGRPFYYYIPIMFKYAIPWVVLLPVALLSPFYRIWGRRRPLMLFLAMWFYVGLLFFSISHGKRPHYILPLMPAAAILMGIVVDDLVFVGKAFSQVFQRRMLVTHAIALGVGGIGCVVIAVMNRQEMPSWMIAAAVGIALFVGLAEFLIKKSPQARCRIVSLFIVGLGAVCVYVLSFYNVSYDEYGATKKLAQEIRQLVPEGQELYSYGRFSTTFLQYYGQPMPIIEEPEDVRPHYLEGHWIFVVMADLPEDCQGDDCNIVLQREKKGSEDRHNIYGYLLHAGSQARSSEPESS